MSDEGECLRLQEMVDSQFDILGRQNRELLAYRSAHERDLQRVGEAEAEREQLIELVERNGFQVMRGDFVLRDGTHSDFYLRPNDVRRLLVNLTAAYTQEGAE